MRWTRQRFARDGVAGRVERLVSDQQRADERCCSVRRSRVVLTPRCWRQVRGGLVGPTGRGQSLNPLGDGGKKARSPGRARRKPLKPSRAGMPGDSGVSVVTNARVFYSTRAAAGALGARHSPRPLISEGGNRWQTSRKTGGEIAEPYLDVIARSEATKQSSF